MVEREGVEEDTMDIAQWFMMGKYGWFVWPAYLIGILILLWGIAQPVRTYKKLHRTMKKKD